ncbi:hypothetical protein [Citrobacter farmeri]|uniref:hypothetical protein n=1 Tax=Citrobacter farmeri TaxID=67824 RepID=UPI00189C5C77|nr:hypothetical protein [Citrobacter farmeri]MDZ7528685.1 hypothetical protein [Citrobacter farmeri]HCD2002497.1 hypothetical protein [Citrobacter farmeri]
MMTLVAFMALRKCFIYQKSAKLRMNGAKGMKKQQTEKKIQKSLVQKNGITIMRLHRHGGCESLHTNSRFG